MPLPLGDQIPQQRANLDARQRGRRIAPAGRRPRDVPQGAGTTQPGRLAKRRRAQRFDGEDIPDGLGRHKLPTRYDANRNVSKRQTNSIRKQIRLASPVVFFRNEKANRGHIGRLAPDFRDMPGG
ncbi:MAG TPA: hypothetical protein VME63_00190 [Dyella sp.]|uniref:hypothetical protein n=1 Tax=Dyella sp. TaxID=1869338 RepID=UPI002C34AD0F|nr:hypothetical protein [Dyella sp.]HTV83795.1 hypothetical protein [Dyella sp.]